MTPSLLPPPDLPHSPQRVVSLVPSMTESLFDLGLGEAVVGITDYCIYPPQAVTRLPRVGGPKDPRPADILALKPDLVLANWEENTRSAVETLQAAGVPVWVTFPQTVSQSLDLLWALAGLFQNPAAAIRLKTLELTLDWIQAAACEHPKVPYFCPIWFDETEAGQPWFMTFNHQTYPHDLLAVVGGENVFASRPRRYPLAADLGLAPTQPPGEQDTRYPRVTLEEVRAAAPQVILLPSEPFAFGAGHAAHLQSLFPEVPAVLSHRVHLIDGTLVTWHGTRLGLALRDLPALFA